jgi:hypothetical protein
MSICFTAHYKYELQNMQNRGKIQQLAKGLWKHDILVDVLNILTLTILLRTYIQCFIYASQFDFLNMCFLEIDYNLHKRMNWTRLNMVTDWTYGCK